MHTATDATRATLKQHMKNAGHNTNSLSKATGIPRTTLTRHLENPRGIRLDDLFAVAKVLDLPPESIIKAAA